MLLSHGPLDQQFTVNRHLELRPKLMVLCSQERQILLVVSSTLPL